MYCPCSLGILNGALNKRGKFLKDTLKSKIL